VERSEFEKRAKKCLQSAQLNYLRATVPLRLVLRCPEAITSPVPYEGRTLSLTRVPAVSISDRDSTISVHPNLARIDAPRYVMLNLFYYALADYLVRAGDMDQKQLQSRPPQKDKADKWLAKYEYPPT
jgi:hypothetical protein